MAEMSKSEMMVSKSFSARFLAIVMMTATGCYMALRSIPIDNQFATLWGVVVTYYFSRSNNGEPGDTPPQNRASDLPKNDEQSRGTSDKTI